MKTPNRVLMIWFPEELTNNREDLTLLVHQVAEELLQGYTGGKVAIKDTQPDKVALLGPRHADAVIPANSGEPGYDWELRNVP